MNNHFAFEKGVNIFIFIG